ncbi:hypothetical protein [Streptomyces geranii]|uniref:hypothetical protein n=1 Tax=Streptomyces geranii TaxID=2058923 RepID=UPI0018E50183|nr:hypothetical protein [Streptomyces geranii]
MRNLRAFDEKSQAVEEQYLEAGREEHVEPQAIAVVEGPDHCGEGREAAVQKRLQHESMAPYLLTTGGGYVFVPPVGATWMEALAGA